MMGVLERAAQTSNCSMAAARKVSAAQRRTERGLGPVAKRWASLPEVVVLPVPLTPTSMMTSGGEGGWVMGASDAVEDGLEFGLEEGFELGAGGDAGAVGALTEVFEDEGGGGGAEVGGEQDGLERGDGGLVDLAGEGDDVGELLGEGVAGAGDGGPHAVEEGAAGGVFGGGGLGLREFRFGRGGLGFGGALALAEEIEGHGGSLVERVKGEVRRWG